MERQLINQGYIKALIALCRLKMERQLINQGNWSHGKGGPQASNFGHIVTGVPQVSNFGHMVRGDHRHEFLVTW